jgi:hypothetical protein
MNLDGKMEVQIHSFLSSMVDESGWSGSRSGLLYLGRKPPVPIEDESDCAPKEFWKFRTSPAAIQLTFLGRPAP